ncbi:MAG: hypothetical protein QW764_04675 [Desulfurococcaceae archaeon]
MSQIVEEFMEKKKKIVLREYYRRNIKTAGLSLSFVVTPEGKLLRPVKEIRSRTGAHGDDVYLIDPPVYVLRYERSCSGKVRWSIWIVEGQDKERRVRVEDVPLQVLRAFLVAVENEGLELNPWEEDEVWEEDEETAEDSDIDTD